MIEIERQLSEAPPICVIVRGFVRTHGPNKGEAVIFVSHYQDEDGHRLAEWDETGKSWYAQFRKDYAEEIAAVLDDCRIQLKGL